MDTVQTEHGKVLAGKLVQRVPAAIAEEERPKAR